MDNPGGWSPFCFLPKFTGTKKNGDLKYSHHALPTGCRPVPADKKGERKRGEFKFHYKGEYTSDDYKHMFGGDDWLGFRSGADEGNMFPSSRMSSLDVDKLIAHGLTESRMKNDDALFFYQLLLPIVEPKYSGIPDDGRLPFHTTVAGWSNAYSYKRGWGTGYGHVFEAMTEKETVRYKGVVHMDAYLGANGDIHRRWREGPAQSDEIRNSMFHHRWLQCKAILKLNDNDTTPKKGEPGYDPAAKFDYIWKVLCHNTNYFTKNADLDLCGDETTFAFGGFGPIIVRIEGKPGVNKGAQIFVLVDKHRFRMRAYTHRHNHASQERRWMGKGWSF